MYSMLDACSGGRRVTLSDIPFNMLEALLSYFAVHVIVYIDTCRDVRQRCRAAPCDENAFNAFFCVFKTC